VRQVPHRYTIIGNGRLATHMAFYLQSLGLPMLQWSRATHTEAELHHILSQTTHIWLLIRDAALQSFIDQHLQPYLHSHILIHSSGSLTLPQAFGAHPLQTFTPALYPAEAYLELPFFIDAQAPAFQALLPGLTNPHYRIEPQKKALYHALCVMANNFTTLLWQKFFTSMEAEFQLPPAQAQHLLQQTCDNLINNPQSALTGPIARGDIATLERNINALENDPYQAIFKAFVAAHIPQTTQIIIKEKTHGQTCE
jgi:2-dehydropantoate 2-reductase